MPKAGLYKTKFTRMVATQDGPRVDYEEGDELWGYHDGKTIKIRNFPELVAKDQLYDPEREVTYKIASIDWGDNEFICHLS